MKLLSKALLYSFFSIASISIQAGLLGYTYTDMNGDVVTKTTNDLQNAQSSALAVVSAGLDRKVRVTVQTTSGNSIESHTSGIITADDRITFMSKDYYGKEVTLSSLSSHDGSYKVVTEILDVAGNVVGTEQEDLKIDRTPPTHGVWFATGIKYGGMVGGTAPVWKLGFGDGAGVAGFEAHLLDVSDANGIESIRVRVYDQDNNVFKEINTSYNQASQLVHFPYNATGLFPENNLTDLLGLEAIVEDKAGNIITSTRQDLYFDNYKGAPKEPFGVYDPDSTNVLGPGLVGYEPYKPGMVVKKNPITLAWRVRKDNYKFTGAEGGLYLYNSIGAAGEAGQDDEYVYLYATAPYGNKSSYFRWNHFGEWRADHIYYDLILSDQAPQMPVQLRPEFYVDSIGWLDAEAVVPWEISQLPQKISKLRWNIQPQPYDVRVQHRDSYGYLAGTQYCIIPAGETQCEQPANAQMNPGTKGYLHGTFSIQSWGLPDGDLQGWDHYANWSWNDEYSPVISSINYDRSTQTIQALVYQEGAGQFQDRLRLEDAWLSYGNDLRLQPINSKRNNEHYEFMWDLTQLPEGVFDLNVWAQERHGLTDSETALTDYIVDRSNPMVDLKYGNKSTFHDIVGLDDIQITVSDLSDYEITEVKLMGGPINDLVYLATREVEEDTYALEYPRIFPSMEAGQEYTLTVTVTDEFGNVGTDVETFTYIPENFITLDEQSTLAVSQPLLLPSDEPLGMIRTGQLRTKDGQLAYGEQIVYFTLRSDSSIALIVGGNRVEPGATTELRIMTNADAALEIPVYPAETGMVGTYEYMLDIPSLKTKYSDS